MTKKLIGLLAAIAVVGGVATLLAQEGTKPANVGEGTMMVKGKNYPLKNAVAYESTIDGEEGIAVLLSGPTISSEKINEARKSERKVSRLISGDPTSSWSSRRAGEFKGLGRRRRRHLLGQAYQHDMRYEELFQERVCVAVAPQHPPWPNVINL